MTNPDHLPVICPVCGEKVVTVNQPIPTVPVVHRHCRDGTKPGPYWVEATGHITEQN